MVILVFATGVDASREAGDAEVHIDAVDAAVPSTRHRLTTAVALYLHVQLVTMLRYKHLCLLEGEKEAHGNFHTQANSE